MQVDTRLSISANAWVDWGCGRNFSGKRCDLGGVNSRNGKSERLDSYGVITIRSPCASTFPADKTDIPPLLSFAHRWDLEYANRELLLPAGQGFDILPVDNSAFRLLDASLLQKLVRTTCGCKRKEPARRPSGSLRTSRRYVTPSHIRRARKLNALLSVTILVGWSHPFVDAEAAAVVHVAYLEEGVGLAAADDHFDGFGARE